jgi:hypothetical protein
MSPRPSDDLIAISQMLAALTQMVVEGASISALACCDKRALSVIAQSAMCVSSSSLILELQAKKSRAMSALC